MGAREREPFNALPHIAASAHRKGRVANPMGPCPGHALGHTLLEAGPLPVKALHTCPGLSLSSRASGLLQAELLSLFILSASPAATEQVRVCCKAQCILEAWGGSREQECRASLYRRKPSATHRRYTSLGMCRWGQDHRPRTGAQTQSTAMGWCTRAVSTQQGTLDVLCSPREGTKSSLWQRPQAGQRHGGGGMGGGV